MNTGATFELTPTLRSISNVNYLRFMATEPLEVLLKQPSIDEDLGIDVSTGLEWRPLLSNNIIVKGFGAVFVPLKGFRDIYEAPALFQAGTDLILQF